jgi:GT2 family glycosyltransferase
MLSIIIPTNRPEEQLERCLKAIADNTPQEYEVLLIREGVGMNAAYNIGFSQAKGDYIVMLHDDCEVLPHWVDVLPIHAGALLYGEDGGTFWIWGGKGDGYATTMGCMPDYSGFLILSRHCVDDIGPLDETYVKPGYQDTDLGRQLRARGFVIETLPGMLIHHHYRDKVKDPIPEFNKQYYENKWKDKP